MFNKIPEQFSSYVALPKTEEAREAARQRAFAAVEKHAENSQKQLRGYRADAVIIDEVQFMDEKGS